MAISVDTVYKTVLLILNKEQRGYITPEEFNKMAAQAQLGIFEKYFEDLNQALRMPENDSEYANRVKTLQEKIQQFEVNNTLLQVSNAGGYDSVVHRLGTLTYTENDRELQQLTQHDYNLINKSKLTKPTLDFPVYVVGSTGTQTQISVYPTIATDKINAFYIRKPSDPQWNYVVGSLGEFNSINPSDFEIDDTDQTELILSILMYAGVVIRDQSIVQAASSQIAQENANQKS